MLTIYTLSHCKLGKNSSAYINKQTHSNMPVVDSVIVLGYKQSGATRMLGFTY